MASRKKNSHKAPKKKAAKKANPIPAGYHSVTPYLMVPDTLKEIDFLKKAFGAKVTTPPMMRPDGTAGHAEVQIGTSRVMMGGAMEGFPATPMALYLYVKDSDAVYKKALEAGATSIMPPTNQFYGDRHGGVKDPGGNTWWIATRVEDVPLKELERRHAEMMKTQFPKQSSEQAQSASGM
ncbi:MAG: VOC family protein [Bdellovibrionota bacterium]